MTAAHRRPNPSNQPELPLSQPPAERHPPGEDAWRLDEHTRQIGLRGVALARARLQRPEASADGDAGGDGPAGRAGRDGRDGWRRRAGPGPSGRAA